MSAAHVATEIARFLASDEPEVLSITGRWGVGKTFSWNHYLAQAKAAGAVKLKAYAYVSLFGKRSLEDLKQSIFESTEPTAVANPNSIEDAAAALGRLARRASQFLANTPKIGDVAKFASQFYFLAVRQQIICIDDLERAGQGLDANDVLGLASFLKERRGCKVVILLNREELLEADGVVYAKQLEKVADTVLTFEPTAAEAAQIGVASDSGFGPELARLTSQLGITNIRVIKRIERFVRRLKLVLADFDAEVFDQALQSAALLGWSVYQPGLAPPIEFLKSYNQLADQMQQDASQADAHANDRLVLQRYGYTMTDEFDLCLIESLEKGYVDEPALRQAADVVQAKKRAAKREGSFQAAWDRFHGSFDNDQDQVLDQLYESSKRSLDQISPANLSGTIETLRALGRPKQADELIALYVDAYPVGSQIFDLDRYPFAGHVRDPKVIEAFKAKYATAVDKRDPVEVLRQIGDKNSWNNEDLSKIAEMNAEDMYALFKAARCAGPSDLVRGALQFRSISNPTPEMAKVTAAALEALARIGAESPLNARRVRIYGVEVA